MAELWISCALCESTNVKQCNFQRKAPVENNAAVTIHTDWVCVQCCVYARILPALFWWFRRCCCFFFLVRPFVHLFVCLAYLVHPIIEQNHTGWNQWCNIESIAATKYARPSVGLDLFASEQSCCFLGFSKLFQNSKIRNIVCHCLQELRSVFLFFRIRFHLVLVWRYRPKCFFVSPIRLLGLFVHRHCRSLFNNLSLLTVSRHSTVWVSPLFLSLCVYHTQCDYNLYIGMQWKCRCIPR